MDPPSVCIRADPWFHACPRTCRQAHEQDAIALLSAAAAQALVFFSTIGQLPDNPGERPCIIHTRSCDPTPTPMPNHESLLRSSYAAFNARDIEAALEALGPEVEWPDQLEGTLLHGPQAVKAYWRRQWNTLDPTFDLRHAERDKEGHVVVTLLQTVRGLDGVTISQGLVRHVYEFEGGLVRRMRVLL